ncbi:MAG: acetyl-CoA C-acyltransferase [Candidatus Limnocylindria bacterium]|nr:acetyl-CoA C-acyltransferase [Candidatus Limnocylindria bacterium]
MGCAVILGGCRTPFVKAGTELAGLDVLELAKAATVEALARTEVASEDVGEVIWGNVTRPVAYHNLARELALALSLPPTAPAFTVGMACASACVAITSAADHVANGTADLVIAGGSESLSNVPLEVGRKLARALIRAAQAKTLPARLSSFAGIRPGDLAPVASGIRETSTGLTMGESAERMAAINGISREAQDAWAHRSHALAAAGIADGRLAAEVGPVFLQRGTGGGTGGGAAVTADTHVRRDTTLEKLAALRPVFDRAHGTVTAGNASPLTDGGAAIVVASEERARALGLRPLAAIRSYAYAAVDPAGQLLIAPAYAIPIALRRAGLALRDLDLIEMHEAFAAQVLATFKVLEENGAGRVDQDLVNVMGGSIALGHPFGATGARVVLTLARELARRGGRYGLASVCAAGGNGAAIVIENLTA